MTDFVKMHGCGNDFILLDGRKDDFSYLLADSGRLATLCDRRFGIGCDQFIVIGQGQSGADADMIIRNSDGSIAGMCGNAARCVASILMRESGQGSVTLSVGDRLLKANRTGDLVTIDMGLALSEGKADVGIEGLPIATTVDMGNPHTVFAVQNADDVDLAHIGPMIETHRLFPNKTNVEFISTLSNGIRMRVWERGAGITLACGSGACASALAAHRLGLAPSRMDVVMDGGTLILEIASDGRILMTGPVTHVYRGTF